MFSSLCLLALASPSALVAVDDMEFTPTVFDRGTHLRIRLLCEGGQAPHAIDARAVVSTAEAGGKELATIEGLPSTGNEVRRPDKRVVVWIDVKAPAKDVPKLAKLEGELELLAGGAEREVRATGFTGKKSRKLESKALSAAGVELRAHVNTLGAYRIIGVNGKGRISDLYMEGTQCDYHATNDPANPHLIAHARKGKIPRGAVVVVEVTDAAGQSHTFRLEDLKATTKVQPLAEDLLKPHGVSLTIVTGDCHELHVRADSDELELLDLDLAVGDDVVPFDEVMTTTRELQRLEVMKAYGEIPKKAELVLTIREGATWSSVPFALSDLTIRRD